MLENTNFQSIITTLNLQISQLNSHNLAKDAEIDYLKAENLTKTAKIDDFETTLKGLKLDLAQALQDKEKILTNHINASSDLSLSKETINNLTLQIDRLQRESENLQKNNEKYIEQIANMQTEKLTLVQHNSKIHIEAADELIKDLSHTKAQVLPSQSLYRSSEISSCVVCCAPKYGRMKSCAVCNIPVHARCATEARFVCNKCK